MKVRNNLRSFSNITKTEHLKHETFFSIRRCSFSFWKWEKISYTRYSNYSRLLLLFARCLTGCNGYYGLPFWSLIAEKAISILWRTRFRCVSISLLCLIEIFLPPHKVSFFSLSLAGVDSADISRDFFFKILKWSVTKSHT